MVWPRAAEAAGGGGWGDCGVAGWQLPSGALRVSHEFSSPPSSAGRRVRRAWEGPVQCGAGRVPSPVRTAPFRLKRDMIPLVSRSWWAAPLPAREAEAGMSPHLQASRAALCHRNLIQTLSPTPTASRGPLQPQPCRPQQKGAAEGLTQASELKSCGQPSPSCVAWDPNLLSCKQGRTPAGGRGASGTRGGW